MHRMKGQCYNEADCYLEGVSLENVERCGQCLSVLNLTS